MTIGKQMVRLTNVDKVFWPKLGITKGDMIRYYVEMAPFILPHLRNRPLTTIRFPNGVKGKSFYQKNAPSESPDWIETFSVYSEKSNRTLRFVLANDIDTLIWLSNQACLELHPWFSIVLNPDKPTNIAFDLDPSVPGFERVRETAFYIKKVLDELHIQSFPKTSGATGIQIFVPILWKYSFRQTRQVTEFITRYVVQKHPHLCTIERFKNDRGTKVYIDYLQHAQNKTLISPYSLRATQDATVSAPITWKELETGANPEWFTIKTMPRRVQTMGDLYEPLTREGISLDDILRFLRE